MAVKLDELIALAARYYPTTTYVGDPHQLSDTEWTARYVNAPETQALHALQQAAWAVSYDEWLKLVDYIQGLLARDALAFDATPSHLGACHALVVESLDSTLAACASILGPFYLLYEVKQARVTYDVHGPIADAIGHELERRGRERVTSEHAAMPVPDLCVPECFPDEPTLADAIFSPHRWFRRT